MKFVFCLLVILFTSVLTQRCTHKDVLNIYGRSIHDFSTSILSRVAEEKNGHFVFSPLATWLQLVTLAEGAKGQTLREIKQVTRLTRGTFRVCYKKIIKGILNDLYLNLSDAKHSSLIIIDKYYNVKSTYKSRVTMIDNVKILSLNFDDNDESADTVNQIVNEDTNGGITEAVYPEYFDYSSLLLIHAANFKSAWKYPFNPSQTETVPFFSDEGVTIGFVNMMKTINRFNYTEIGLINSKILEIPCENTRLSMLLFLPINTSEPIKDLYDSMMNMNLRGVFNKFRNEGEKIVDVSIPRFKVISDMDDMRDLLLDMGVTRAFYPHKADLKGISNYTLSASLISQTAKIEVTEESVSAIVAPEMLVENSDAVVFNANKPFGFVLIDRDTNIILFGGMYSIPDAF